MVHNCSANSSCRASSIDTWVIELAVANRQCDVCAGHGARRATWDRRHVLRHPQQLEYDFVIAPGARPTDAAMIVGGADAVRLDANGDLVLGVGAPIAAPASSASVAGAWRRARCRGGSLHVGPGSEPHRLHRQVRPYAAPRDRPRPGLFQLVRRSGADEFVDVALDANGFIYVLGVSKSGAAYPTTPGAFQPAKPGATGTSDYVVTKFNPAGTAVVYSTYFGGTADDYISSSTSREPWPWTRSDRCTSPARPSPRTSR